MAYIGRGTDSISNVEVLDNLTFNGSASYTLQKSSVNFVPSSANNLLISISGVVQQGNFSVSGSTITFDTTVSASDTCDWILHYGTGLITTVADGAITEAKLGSNAVTTAKINNGAITSAKLDSGLALGKIGQVLYTSYSTAVTNSTTSYVDTGLTLNITPSATSSKILVYVSQHMFVEDGTSNGTSGALQLNGSISGLIAIGNIGRRYPDTIQQMEQVPLYYLDSPNTTSAVTYKTQFKLQSGSSIVCQRNSEPSMITLMEVLV